MGNGGSRGRVRPTAASLPPGRGPFSGEAIRIVPEPGFARQVQENYDNDIGYDPAREEAANRAAAEIVRGSQVYIGMSERRLQMALQTGRVPTAYEHVAAHDEEERDRLATLAQAESDNFNLRYSRDISIDPQDRPVYGYLAKDARGLAGGALTSDYGPIRVALRNDTIGRRTTWMAGDSGQQAYEDNGYPTGYPVPLTAPSHWAIPHSGLIRTDKADVGLNASGPHGMPYAEAQVHGGVHIRDIASVTFTQPPSHDLTETLAAHKIPWVIAAPTR